jgi:hypothetical protein
MSSGAPLCPGITTIEKERRKAWIERDGKLGEIQSREKKQIQEI